MRLLLWLLLGYIGFRIVKGILAQRKEPVAPAVADTETYQDPICGVYVTAADAVIGRIETQRVYFCSADCLEKYRKQLEQQ